MTSKSAVVVAISYRQGDKDAKDAKKKFKNFFAIFASLAS
jgi:hypothetical protein